MTIQATHSFTDSAVQWLLTFVKSPLSRSGLSYQLQATIGGTNYTYEPEGETRERFMSVGCVQLSAQHKLREWLGDVLKEGEVVKNDLYVAWVRLLSPYYAMKGQFVFNPHNVCLNPERINIEQGTSKIEIRLACCPAGRWGFSFSIDTNEGSHSWAVGGRDCLHQGRQEALIAAVQYGKKHHYIESQPKLKDLLNELVMQNAQLSLF